MFVFYPGFGGSVLMLDKSKRQLRLSYDQEKKHSW